MPSCPSFRARRSFASLIALIACVLLAWPLVAGSDPAAGFVEEWPGTSLQGWSGGAHLTFSNPGTGGAGGAGDGFLLVTLEGTADRFGTRSFGAEYTGDWTGAGINFVRVSLNDIGATGGLEIHFGIGIANTNFWLYDQAFIPPSNQWASFVVDLSDSADFTRIFNADPEGYAWTLEHVTNVHLRHDLAPYAQNPDVALGSLGIDRLELLGSLVGVGAPGPRTGTIPILHAPYPNPSRGSVTVGVETVDAAAVSIEVVDVQGRLVRRAMIAGGQAGLRMWVWDGRDEDGRRVGAGSYRLRAVTPSGGVSRSLVRLGN